MTHASRIALLASVNVAVVLAWGAFHPRAEVTIAVADGASHRDATSFDLASGIVRADLAATAGGRRVAPLVPRTWTPDAPVPMWAVDETPGDVTRAVAVDAQPYLEAIAEVERVHGIRGEVGAPVVRLVDPTTTSDGSSWLALALALLNAVALALMWWFRRARPA